MKLIKTRKDHQCWGCGGTIKKGDSAKAKKVFPNEAKSMGMIDVFRPLYLIYHSDIAICMINQQKKITRTM